MKKRAMSDDVELRDAAGVTVAHGHFNASLMEPV